MTTANCLTKVNSAFIQNLLYGITHDMGAPARHVVQLSEMLKEHNDTSISDDKRARWISLIHDSGARIQAMLGELSHLASLQCSTQETQLLNLDSLFDARLTFHKDELLHTQQQLSVEKHGNWNPINGIEIHWSTLFSCLIKNALLFQPRTSEKRIKLSASVQVSDVDCTFTLADNGIGMNENQCKEVLRPFKRINCSDDYPGMGMGLTYCQFIAELNQGSFTLDSRESGGIVARYSQPLEPTMTQSSWGNNP